ncbi:uncharacterized protein ecscr isoform X2 [Onychostoma macrolepis]|uniref:uncharacterized protein ecscr isoform X2 n=1 Tax=Onychostoma macrolepis TaxID=369639 RepID=UPI00272A27D5|nr:uncharacterized protein ecscr isoform X2 [Onychostoma macrolepis]
MEQLFFLLIPLVASLSIIPAGNDSNIPTTEFPNTTAMSPWSVVSTVTLPSQYDNGVTSHTSKTVSATTAPVSFSHTGSTDGSSLSLHTTSGQSIITSSALTTPKSYTGTTLNSTSSPAAKIAGSTDGSGLSSHNTSGIKSFDSVVSDSNMTSNCEKESITLVSVRTINTENNTDSPQMSSVRSTIVDNDDQDFTRDLLGIKDGL